MTEISFPRQHARTRRFSLGVPRGIHIAPDGQRVLFLRTRSGSDPVTCLYELDVRSGVERLVLDPTQLAHQGEEELAPEERARRERARESSGGIVRCSPDRSCGSVTFDLSGRVYVLEVASGVVSELPVQRPAVEARMSPSGDLVAYVCHGALRVVGVAATGPGDGVLAAPDGEEPGDVTYGLAEFVAAEEMDRLEGYWWSPDSSRLLVARADTSRVARRYIADPAHPTTPPLEVAYPAAGTPNADVTLHLVSVTEPDRRLEVTWDRTAFEYLARVSFTEHGLLVAVQSRDQRRLQLLEVDVATGATAVVREDTDEAWVDLDVGVPARLSDGATVWVADAGPAKRLLVGDDVVTPDDLQVRGVLGVDGDVVLFTASNEPTEVGVWSWSPGGGLSEVTGGGGGVATGWRRGGTSVIARRSLERAGVSLTVLRDGEEVAAIASVAEVPSIVPRPHLRRAGSSGIRTAVLFPEGHEPGSSKLPVLMDPYGGPHVQMVLAASGMYLTAQWFADQGFCVVIADGRGTPGRGPAWDRAVFGEIAGPVLDDQVTALHAAAAEFGDLDLRRVAIRGWSFGGYLAALAVLRRPDVFHAAVSGAPPTDWRLYDTHYTERYLGHPDTSPGNYERTSLLNDAGRLERPLLLIHGLADDNVAVANTLQLSAALLAAGCQHSVLPLSGVTHMTPQEVVAENLLLLQLDFLRTALGMKGEIPS